MLDVSTVIATTLTIAALVGLFGIALWYREKHRSVRDTPEAEIQARAIAGTLMGVGFVLGILGLAAGSVWETVGEKLMALL